MNRSTGGLGRGLGELFQSTSTPAPQPVERKVGDAAAEALLTGTQQHSEPLPDGSYYAELPTASITPNPHQPRQVFDEEALDELAASIEEVGLLQPIVVRATGPGAYQLVMGERRLRAHEKASLTTIGAIVRGTEDDTMLRDALLENLHRANLNPLEEAAAYQQLLTDFGCTQDELATRIRRSRPQISNTIRLLKLPTAVQRRVAAGVLSAGHAKALLMLDDEAAQERLGARIVAEGLSVRATEELAMLQNGVQKQQPRKAGPRAVDPRYEAAAEQLAGRLDTTVQVSAGRRRGKVVIDFADADDLDRILSLLGQESGAHTSWE